MFIVSLKTARIGLNLVAANKVFFLNRVNIQLKSGQRLEGLLSRVDYKNSSVVF
jgi:hypothetical protein